MWIRIEPLDVLLFREAKPFSAGENVTAVGQFPPTPLPLVGALRNRMLAERNVDLQKYNEKAEMARKGILKDEYEPFKWVGKPDDLGPLKMMGPFLISSDNTLCLPSPKDLLVSGFGNLALLKAEKAKWPLEVSSPDLGLYLESPKSGMETLEEKYLKGDDLAEYLLGNAPGGAIPDKEIIVREPRLGIELAPTRTAKSGQIYTVGFTRMKEKTGFLMSVESELGDQHIPLSKEGFLTLGGESRAARFRKVTNEDLPLPFESESFKELQEELISQLTGSKRFKVYLMTPAIFHNGWLPDGMDEKVDSNGKKTYDWNPVPDVTATLVAAAVGKPQVIGGWDLVSQSPRPMLRAVPAGSVYYLETNESLGKDAATQIVEKIHFKSLMTPKTGEASFLSLCRSGGFGLTAIGLWKNEEV